MYPGGAPTILAVSEGVWNSVMLRMIGSMPVTFSAMIFTVSVLPTPEVPANIQVVGVFVGNKPSSWRARWSVSLTSTSS